MMEVIRSSGTLILTRRPKRNISEEVILHSHRRENFKSYIKIFFHTFPNYNYKVEEDEVGYTSGTDRGEDERV
jgi:hypothetical protein